MRDIGLELVARIDATLPQTQCTKCGFAGCRPYAEALATGVALINQCPPGGDVTIRKLSILLGQRYKPLNPKHGPEQPFQVAAIDEAHCIGCTLCIQACPVDAIVGGARHMHTVIATHCTGCDLCIPSCPVDCIKMTHPAKDYANWNTERADSAKRRFEQRQMRRRIEQEHRKDSFVSSPQRTDQRRKPKLSVIQAAIERARILRTDP